MKILGLDSSGLVASVAVVEDDNMLAEYTVNYKKTQMNSLTILGEQYMKEELIEWFSRDIEILKKEPKSN